jgi:O-antigen/teichoic acid export membrane protein
MVPLRHRLLDPLHSPQLAKNSVALFVNTLLAAAFGFLFWAASARLFTPASVGSVAAVVSLIPLLGTIAGFGLPDTTIRFFSSSSHPRSFLLRSLALSTAAGLLAGLVWWALFRSRSTLSSISVDGWFAPVLVLSVAASAVSSVSTACLVALRRPYLILFETSVGGLTRLVIAFSLSSSGTVGLFLAAQISALLSLLTSLYVVSRHLEPSRGSHRFSSDEIRFAASSWVSTAASLAPRSLAISIVSWRLGAETAAFVAIPLMIYPLLTLVPSASARALYAEGSNAPQEYHRLARQMLQTSMLFTSVVAALVSLFAPLALAVFGSRYSAESATLLRLLTVAAIFSIPNFLVDTTLNIRKDRAGYVATNLLGVCTSLLAVLVFSKFGTTGIGLAWVVGQISYTVVGLLVLFRRKDSPLRLDTASMRTAITYLRTSNPQNKAGSKERSSSATLAQSPPMVFIITYGRTGSTVLQSLLNEHENVSVHGENHNYVLFLYRSYRALQSTSAHVPLSSVPKSDPWFGASRVDPNVALELCRKSILNGLLSPPPGTVLAGFKEVRHTPEHFTSFQELLDYVHFLDALFPDAKFVINTRNPASCAQSGWWRTNPDSATTLTTSETWMRDLYGHITKDLTPDRAILLEYDRWSNDPMELVKLQTFLGLPADERLAAKVLGKKLQHMQPHP